MSARGTISIEKYRRLHALNPIFATDNYVISELAARFGVTESTIIADRQYIMKKWWPREECQTTLSEREKQAETYKLLRAMAIESFKRSKQDKEEITTRFDDKVCEDCNGTGRLPQCKCLNCDGTGHVTEEVIVRKVTGQAGDASFLREARACTDSICRLLALDKPAEEKITHVVKGTLNHKIEDKYADADPEAILEAKAALARLRESARSKVIEGKVIEEGEEG